MPQSLPETPDLEPKDYSLREIGELSESVLRVLSSIGAARNRFDLASDEALIFLAIGQIGMNSSDFELRLRAVPITAIAELLSIPRETVRRKCRRLTEIDLVVLTSRGLLIRNISEWMKVAELFQKETSKHKSSGRVQ
jgi:hypothetical protein